MLKIASKARRNVWLHALCGGEKAPSAGPGAAGLAGLPQTNISFSKEHSCSGTKAIFRLQSGFNSLSGAQSTAGYLSNRQADVGLANDR
ncbi:hypothetical protein QFZ94_003897 [Paraburkholderia sp. JPY465]